MGFPEELQTFFKDRRRKFGIGFEEGFEALARILTRKLSQGVVSLQDFIAMMAGSKDFSISTILGGFKQLRQSQPRYPRPVLGTPFVAPRNQIEKKVADIWGDLLGIEQIGVNDIFFELGGHSLMGAQLISRLQQSLKVSLTLSTLYVASTIAEISQIIGEMLSEEMND